MAEIGCKKCTSPDCKGCNSYILETALKQGQFDALMDGNRTIHIATNVRENIKGEWTKAVVAMDRLYDNKGMLESLNGYICKHCKEFSIARFNYCPNCGAKMDGKDGDA